MPSCSAYACTPSAYSAYAPQPEKPPAEEPTGKKTHRGGRKRLTMDDIDRIFEIFFTMTAEEKDLIRGLLDSDKERRAAAPR